MVCRCYKKVEAFKSTTPTKPRDQELAIFLFMCLIEHDKCLMYKTKHKLKRHLLFQHNFCHIEKEIRRRPYAPLSKPQRTMKEQNNRYNDKTQSNLISNIEIFLGEGKDLI